MRISDWSSDVCSSDLWHGGWSRWEPLETVARGYPTCSVHVGSGADTLTGAVYAVLNATGGCMLHVPSVTAAFTPPRASHLGALGGILASRMLAMWNGGWDINVLMLLHADVQALLVVASEPGPPRPGQELGRAAWRERVCRYV